MESGGGVAVLGPVAIDGDTSSIAPRDRVVLGVLVLHRGHAVDADVLVDALWGDEPPATANKVVQGCVARLRKSLGAGAIETVQHGYRLDVSSDRVDVGRFERLIARSRELLSLGEPERAAHAAGEALGLWRGRAFLDLEEWEPGRTEAARLDELRLDAEELRVDAELRSGHVREVMGEAQRLVGSAPFRERRWALLATAQYQAGRQADALATIRQARRLLAEELGLDPGPDLVGLEDAILQQDPSLAPAAAEPEPSTTCPYRGLVPYDVADSEAFFGRDEELGECLRRLADTGVVVVVGPSGSGKSSLVRAGVGAALQRDGERVTVITPGVHPMDELASVPSAGPTTLAVDQCEEVVTVCRDVDERSRFLDALVERAERERLVVALRADRLGEVSAHAPFARLVERGLYLLQPMDESHLRAAIEGPALQAGLRFEPGLVDLLVRDVEGEPGALPLLSHALRQTWERREGRTLTVEGYRASGGIRGAVAQTAEAVFAAAPPEQRAMLRDLMLRLVAPSPEGEPVRSRVPRRMVATDAEHEQVIERLVVARLVISDEESVELAHEALARAWPRLRDWLDDDVEGQRIWRHLAASADAWSAMGRPDSELYRGVRLARAIEWRERTDPDLNADEVAYLDASAGREEHEARARRRRQRRTVAIVGTAAVLALVLAVVTLVARNDAARERDVAEARRLMASSSAVIDTDPELALLLATEAAHRLPGDIEAETALHAAVAVSRTVLALDWPTDLRWTRTDMTGDGSTIAWVGMPGSVVEVRDVDTGDVRWRHEFDVADPGDLRLSPKFVNDDQELLVAVLFSPTDEARANDPPDAAGVHVFDVATGERDRTLDSTECGAWHADVGRGWAAITISDPDRYTLWNQYSASTISEHGCAPIAGLSQVPIDVVRTDVVTNEHETIISEQPVEGERYVSLSRDGRRASISMDGEPRRVIDVDTGEVVLELPRPPAVGPTSLDAEGTRVAFAGETQHQTAIYDVDSAELIATTAGHPEGTKLFAVRFSLDGRRLYTGGSDGAVRVWDVETGEETDSVSGMNTGLNEVWGSRGGTRLAFSTFSPEVRVVDLAGGRPERPIADDCDAAPADGPFRHRRGLGVRGDRLVTVVSCLGVKVPGRAYVADVESHEVLAEIPAFGQTVGWSDDGAIVVSQEWSFADGDVVGGSLVAHEVETGKPVMELGGLCDAEWEFRQGGPDRDVAFTPSPAGSCLSAPDPPFAAGNFEIRLSPDGTLVAANLFVADGSSHVLVVDTESGTVRGVVPGGAIAFARDGSELLVSNFVEGSWVAYDAETLDKLREGPPVGVPVSEEAHYLPALDQLVAPTGVIGDSAIVRFDVETLEVVGEIADAHESSITDLDLRPAAGLLASSGIDGHAKVWDLESGRLLHDVVVAGQSVESLAMSEDGKTLYTATASGPLMAWTLDFDELLDIARSRITRGFTEADCARYFGDEDCPVYEAASGPQPAGT